MAKHHFVPKIYLKGFVDPSSRRSRNPYLWVVDLQNRTMKRRGPENVANFVGFNDWEKLGEEAPSIESLFSQIESRVNRVISKLRNQNFQLTMQDRHDLSIFLGCQIARTPSARRIIENRIRISGQNLLHELIQDEESIKDFTEKFVVVPEKDQVLVRTLEVAQVFAEIIFVEMYWLFRRATGGMSFFTSDNPVSVGKAEPISFKSGRIPEHEIAFPISPSCFLLLHQYEWEGVVEGVDFVDSDKVNKINQLMLRIVDRYVFCSSEQQGKWVLEQSKG